MENNWQELWTKNYNCEGDCEKLAEFVKKVGFGKKTDASYLPWAVAQRIFEKQGGTLETIYTEKDNDKTIVETEKIPYKVDLTDEGIKYFYSYCFFVNVKATWNGRTYIEKYPIQDSSGNAISSGFTQNDINKSLQRARVKAIAIVSGIGYKLYETGDLQFDASLIEDQPAKAKPAKTSEKKSEEQKHVAQHTVVETTEEIKVVPEPTPEVVVEQPSVQFVEPEVSKVVCDREELTEEVKNFYLSRDSKKTDFIKEFAKTHTTTGKLSIKDLSDEDLVELVNHLRSL